VVTAQPADDAGVDAPGNAVGAGFLRGLCFVEADAFVHLLEDAIDGDVVPMGVGVQTPAEVLVSGVGVASLRGARGRGARDRPHA
jgi:hypothetical protein